MGDILGVGLSHFPGFVHGDEEMSMRLKQVISSPKVPPELKDPANWPEQMRREWADDQATAHAAEHRKRFVDGVRKIRQAIDDFRPDAVVIFGDDQYENLREDLIPPLCIYILPEFDLRPFQAWLRAGEFQPNVWGEPRDVVFHYNGQPEIARFLAKAALEAEFDMSYAYTLRNPDTEGLGHAFNFTTVFLDWDRKGWEWPIVPVAINAYGSGIIRNRGLVGHLFDNADAGFDPPAPSPKRCFDLGAALARALKASPWRTVLVGTSSWSHAFLTEKTHYVYPDVESDRRRFEDLRSGNYLALRKLTIAELEDAGEHELLNWMPLIGAMHELGQKPSFCDFLETYTLNSCKVNAIFPPN
ncbi:MAG TPA: extradiol ring-cleavage dioxygenase [Chloroflexota bacterium]|nr:extradiol ring-cleavage dioxygenase [Chloroflexota bacterium]